MNKINSSFFKKFGNFLRSSYIFIVLAIIYIPLIMVVLISFNPQTDKGNINLNFGIPNGINYLKLFENNTFINALLNTLLLSVLVTPVSVLIGIMACYGIWKSKSTTKNFVLGTARLSMLNPDAITGISLLLLFSSTWIPMGLNLGFFTVLLAHISFCTPYAIITIYPRMAKMKQNLVLASYDLGESKIHTFIKVIIPYLMPSIMSATAIVIAMSWDDFIITNLVNGSFQTLGTAIYMTRKGIKAWVVTFGAIMIIIALIFIIIMGSIKANKIKKSKVSIINKKGGKANA